MDFFKRDLAPITDKAWQEIDDRAKDVLETQLAARRAVNVVGPEGLEFTALSEGRLENIEEDETGVKNGVYKVKPLTESRISFELNRWELDNIERGAADIDLEPLEDAVKSIALFEDNAILNGLESADITGIKGEAAHVFELGEDSSSILENISKGTLLLKDAMTEKPYILIVGETTWTHINTQGKGYPLTRRIKELTGSEILTSKAVSGAVLVPQNHEDLEFTIGQDLAIGYEKHDSKRVTLFITESFTFRVLDPEIIVRYTL
ncbi:MAG: family 1 encapsulin nanocompartment shell protein [Bacillota bacterium]